MVGANNNYFPHLTLLLRDFELDPAEAGFDTLDEWLEAMIRSDHSTARPKNAKALKESLTLQPTVAADGTDEETPGEFQDAEEADLDLEEDEEEDLDLDFEDAEEGDEPLPASAVLVDKIGKWAKKGRAGQQARQQPKHAIRDMFPTRSMISTEPLEKADRVFFNSMANSNKKESEEEEARLPANQPRPGRGAKTTH